MRQTTAGQAQVGQDYMNTAGDRVTVRGRKAPGYTTIEVDGEQINVPDGYALLELDEDAAGATVQSLVGADRETLEAALSGLTDEQLDELLDLDGSMTTMDLVAAEQDRRAGGEDEDADSSTAPAPEDLKPEGPPPRETCPACGGVIRTRWSVSKPGVAVFDTHHVDGGPCPGSSRSAEATAQLVHSRGMEVHGELAAEFTEAAAGEGGDGDASAEDELDPTDTGDTETAPDPAPAPKVERTAPAQACLLDGDVWQGKTTSADRREIVKRVASLEDLEVLEQVAEDDPEDTQARVVVELERQRKGLREVQDLVDVLVDTKRPLQERAEAADAMDRLASTKRASEQRPGMLAMINRHADTMGEVRTSHRLTADADLAQQLRDTKAGNPPPARGPGDYHDGHPMVDVVAFLHRQGLDSWPDGLPELVDDLTADLRGVKDLLPATTLRATALGMDRVEVLLLALALERQVGGRRTVVDELERQLRRYGWEPEAAEDTKPAAEPEAAEDTRAPAPAELSEDEDLDASVPAPPGDDLSELPPSMQVPVATTARALELVEDLQDDHDTTALLEALDGERHRAAGPRPVVVEALQAAVRALEPVEHQVEDAPEPEAQAAVEDLVDRALAAPPEQLLVARKPDGAVDVYLKPDPDGTPVYVGPGAYPRLRHLVARAKAQEAARVEQEHAAAMRQLHGGNDVADVRAAQQGLAGLAAALPALKRLGVRVDLTITTHPEGAR